MLEKSACSRGRVVLQLGAQTSCNFSEVLSTTLCPQGRGAPERKAGSIFPSLSDLAQGQAWTQRASGNTRDVHSRHQVALALIINNSKY